MLLPRTFTIVRRQVISRICELDSSRLLIVCISVVNSSHTETVVFTFDTNVRSTKRPLNHFQIAGINTIRSGLTSPFNDSVGLSLSKMGGTVAACLWMTRWKSSPRSCCCLRTKPVGSSSTEIPAPSAITGGAQPSQERRGRHRKRQAEPSTGEEGQRQTQSNCRDHKEQRQQHRTARHVEGRHRTARHVEGRHIDFHHTARSFSCSSTSSTAGGDI